MRGFVTTVGDSLAAKTALENPTMRHGLITATTFFALFVSVPALGGVKEGVVELLKDMLAFEPNDRRFYPLYAAMEELGVNLIGVHKGVPLGPQPIEATQTWDMDGAAANFPDINFVIYHVGLPFIDETCWQLIRYPNLYASLDLTRSRRDLGQEGYAARLVGRNNVVYPPWIARARSPKSA